MSNEEDDIPGCLLPIVLFIIGMVIGGFYLYRNQQLLWPSPQVGELWSMEAEDPFRDGMLDARILRIKKDYVQYKNVYTGVTMSKKMGDFVRMYDKVE